ncbi:GTP pyrophosphokinase family protein [Paenibacillus sp. NPDC057934]|uniref:GTP pyrophosphokinase n=1 Tax=Paenibacillus sp. NPDC057934 TaxID=3346282 RepID=UPI0036DA920E
MLEDNESLETIGFNFEEHRHKAEYEYMKIQPLYKAFSIALDSILRNCLEINDVYYHSIESRSKEVESFGKKAFKPSNEDPRKPKYKDPLKEITDLAGVRIITFFPKTVKLVDELINSEFEVIERSDKSELLDERLGYQSIHYLIKLNTTRNSLAEYKNFHGLLAEIQVRTILQHAWAEIEHDIQYKSNVAIPRTIKRRFMDLAGLIEIADREFQSIQDEDERLRYQSRTNVQEGRLEDVEITPDALKEYLNKKFGTDGRINSFSYKHEANILIKMGFTNFKQIDDCINGLNDDLISRVIWGTRQGQLSRFEDVLLAGIGENIYHLHPYSKSGNGENWFSYWKRDLEKLRKAGIEIRNYNPKEFESDTEKEE